MTSEVTSQVMQNNTGLSFASRCSASLGSNSGSVSRPHEVWHCKGPPAPTEKRTAEQQWWLFHGRPVRDTDKTCG